MKEVRRKIIYFYICILSMENQGEKVCVYTFIKKMLRW